ncbi:MAG: putative DNA-binding domain-containing protein [Vicinamibacterales bacterium]
MPLAELQQRVRDALLVSDGSALDSLLRGGLRPERRFAVHQRHVEASLTSAIVGRFPATGWLIGGRRIDNAARAFVHAAPPGTPCIAEYGEAFPAFLASWPDTARLRYLRDFATLDWLLGRVAVEVSYPAFERDALAGMDVEALPLMTAGLQPGLHYLRTAWDLDGLMRQFLTADAAERWRLREEEVRLEVRGARGAFHVGRLDAATFTFRVALQDGASLGAAAATAVDVEPTFDPGAALLALIDERLLTALISQTGAHA